MLPRKRAVCTTILCKGTNNGIIYRAKCLSSNKSYVGQSTKTLEERQKYHFAARNCSDTALSRAIRKYGWDNFVWEILHQNVPDKALDDLEKQEIKQFNSFKNGYNLTSGGQGSRRLSEKTKNLISKNNARYWKNKEFSEEHKENLKNNHKGTTGRKHTTESKQKMSENNCRHWKGKKLSEEHKRKMSEAQKERWRKRKCQD
jgi:group I intron endonuclease